MQSRIAAVLLVSLGSFVSPAFAENCPGVRGPRGDGTSLERNVPVKWDVPKGEGLVWKTPLAGGGHAGPIVWKDRVFVVACDEKTQERTLASFDKKSGKELWRKTVFKAPLE